MTTTLLIACAALILLQSVQTVSGFTTAATAGIANKGQLAGRSRQIPMLELRAKDQNSLEDNENDDEEEEPDGQDERISNERIYRELMGIPEEAENKKKPTKGKNNGNNKKPIKRPHDNRDQLPFLVQVMVPPEEPYEQHVLQKVQKKSKKKRRKGKNSEDEPMETEVVGETLGEFPFEKNTSSGDKIEIDNEVYVVERAKCQYKYAGNIKKFVMVRKILQVKPIQRAMQEDYIMRQWNAPPATGFD